ncbi:hypothetical protein EVAR_89812_1 [Eumeta japonica]|uniref:Uncharacterized protein n=1 Tax=Eumeta variegata TaxID=151549 RepID=A0A4C1YJ86_EUMVA|nr:hypothetical protein EVAR_89812_1 [Eumeta japonica]
MYDINKWNDYGEEENTLKPERIMKNETSINKERLGFKNTRFKLSTRKIFCGCKSNCVAIVSNEVYHGEEEEETHGKEEIPIPIHLQKKR